MDEKCALESALPFSDRLLEKYNDFESVIFQVKHDKFLLIYFFSLTMIQYGQDESRE